MSQPNLAKQPSGGVVQKQKVNIYTMMLILSFFAILIACILMINELRKYGPEWPPWNTSTANPKSARLEYSPDFSVGRVSNPSLA